MARLTIQSVRTYASKKYNKGGDVVIECWSDADIARFIQSGGTLKALDVLFAQRYDALCDAENGQGYYW